jgi:hypothetical protein
MTALADQDAPIVVDKPGVYEMSEAAYHADPVPAGSLSSTGARKLLPPSCPALFRYGQDHPVHKDVFDYGSAAHQMVLGVGRPLAVLDAEDWRTKAAQEWRKGVRAEGALPLLAAEHDQIQAMAAALRQHPMASALLCRDDVEPEQSLFWEDAEFGIWRRARLDAMRRPGPCNTLSRIAVTDYKSTRSASPASFPRSVADFGYHQQQAFYADGVAALLGEDPEFYFVAQDKEPPYLVTVFELSDEDVQAGREINRRAMEIYRDCREAGVWPGYAPEDDIVRDLRLPAWASRGITE